ncbi:CPBP family intramembrane glutamic endopeptidase [Metabacillus arenae]|uniref:CPBP family intramembrane metalloprotease n=1 Tax=Metabacillus arenae TaxID=2771434 RepID=A0A926NEK8_9BACI|nr:type II CAAX endopeptidase family protein [Metabacillus arenae]MBD1379811.1 CPBP family intramembrane metalloprotease [Metabacillus arenae]
MKEALLLHSTVLRNIASLFLFGILIIILQTNHYLLMSVWGICAWLFFFNKSMRFFILTTTAFGIGFFLYGYVNSHWITHLNPEGLLIILNRLSLIFLILPLTAISLIYKLPFMRYWQSPQWGELVRVPFILSGFHHTKVSVFLSIAMMINLIAFMPFIVNNGWAYIQEIWWFMLIFSIINSVLEEIIWRGMLLSRFSEHFGNRWAIMITSIGFGLQHYSLGFSWGGCLVFTLGGLFFGAITVKSKSIIPAVIWHMSINALMVLSGMIVK